MCILLVASAIVIMCKRIVTGVYDTGNLKNCLSLEQYYPLREREKADTDYLKVN